MARKIWRIAGKSLKVLGVGAGAIYVPWLALHPPNASACVVKEPAPRTISPPEFKLPPLSDAIARQAFSYQAQDEKTDAGSGKGPDPNKNGNPAPGGPDKKKQPGSSQKAPPDSTQGYTQVVRINEENADSSNLVFRVDQYIDLAKGLQSYLQKDLKICPNEHERFIVEGFGAIRSRDSITYGNAYRGFLSISLSTREWDCDNQVGLMFDVGRKMGLPVGFAVVTEGFGTHMLLKVGKWFMEPEDGKYFDEAELRSRYTVFLISSDPKKLPYTGHENLAFDAKEKGNYQRAVKFYSKAIELAPEIGTLYRHRAACYNALGLPNLAIEDLAMSIELEPNSIVSRMMLGQTYEKANMLAEAASQYQMTVKLDSSNSEASALLKKCLDKIFKIKK